MDYVSEKANESAREMERKFQTLNPRAGVLFVGVQAVPCPDGDSKGFVVRLGVIRELSEETGRALARQVLQKELDLGLKILVSVYRGVSGAAHAQGDEGPRSTQA